MSKKPTTPTATTQPKKVKAALPPSPAFPASITPTTPPKPTGAAGFLAGVGNKGYKQQYKATVDYLHKNPDQIQALIKAVAPKYDPSTGKPISIIDTIAGNAKPDKTLATLIKASPIGTKFEGSSGGGLASFGSRGLIGVMLGWGKKPNGKFDNKAIHTELNSEIQKLMKQGYSHDDAYRSLEQELLQKGDLNTKSAKAIWQKWMNPPLSPAKELQTIISGSIDPAEQQKLNYFSNTADQLEQYAALSGKARTAAFPGGKPSTSGIDAALGVTGHYGNWTPEQIRTAVANAAAQSVPDEFKAMLTKIQNYATSQYDVTKTLQSVGGKADTSWQQDPLLQQLVASGQIKEGPAADPLASGSSGSSGNSNASKVKNIIGGP